MNRMAATGVAKSLPMETVQIGGAGTRTHGVPQNGGTTMVIRIPVWSSTQDEVGQMHGSFTYVAVLLTTINAEIAERAEIRVIHLVGVSAISAISALASHFPKIAPRASSSRA